MQRPLPSRADQQVRQAEQAAGADRSARSTFRDKWPRLQSVVVHIVEQLIMLDSHGRFSALPPLTNKKPQLTPGPQV